MSTMSREVSELSVSHHGYAPTALAERLAAVENALQVGEKHLDSTAVANARAVLERSSQRLRLGPEYTVVAMVGATGSGKSSLFNALNGMEISPVSVRRPTTQEPIASVWGLEGAGPLLDWLEVPENRRTERASVLDGDGQSDLHGLVLLDLPDHDSTQASHRLVVDRLVSMVDLMIWVVDPQKYADDALHTDYLQPLVGHDDVIIVVLNQIDRLGKAATDACRADLRRLLDADGLSGVQLLAASATKGDGIDVLRAVLARAVQQRAAVVSRTSADLRSVAGELSKGVADQAASALPPTRPLVAALRSAAGVPGTVASINSEYLRRASAETGWPVARWLKRSSADAVARLDLEPGGAEDVRAVAAGIVPGVAPAEHSRVELAVQMFGDSAGGRLPESWARATREALPPGSVVVEKLDAALSQVDVSITPPFWWKAASFVHGLLATITSLGAIWWGIALISNTMRPGSVRLLTWVGFPVAGWMLGVGLLAAILTALAAASVARQSVLTRTARLNQDFDDAVIGVAREQVIEPVARVLEQHRLTAAALASVS